MRARQLAGLALLCAALRHCSGQEPAEEAGGAPKPECLDLSDDCAKFAEAGECVENPDWMRLNCKKSCKVCNEIEDAKRRWNEQVTHLSTKRDIKRFRKGLVKDNVTAAFVMFFYPCSHAKKHDKEEYCQSIQYAFGEAAEKAKTRNSPLKGRVAFASMDCERLETSCLKYGNLASPSFYFFTNPKNWQQKRQHQQGSEAWALLQHLNQYVYEHDEERRAVEAAEAANEAVAEEEEAAEAAEEAAAAAATGDSKAAGAEEEAAEGGAGDEEDDFGYQPAEEEDDFSYQPQEEL